MTDTNSALEQRLARLTEAFTGFVEKSEQRETSERVRAYEAQIENAVKASERAIDDAETALARANEDGDPVEIAKANRIMTQRVAEHERAKMTRDNYKQMKAEAERRSGGSSGAPSSQGDAPQKKELDTTNLEGWKDRNKSWYGVDTEMTKAAHAIDKEIRDAGVIAPGSVKYFEAIDRQMAAKFPDKLRSAPSNSSGTTGAREEGGRSAGRIPREVLEGWRRMGINVDDDATLARMVKNREALVRKEILPEEPAYGRVLS